jgi:serine/threonine-protein kinase
MNAPSINATLDFEPEAGRPASSPPARIEFVASPDQQAGADLRSQLRARLSFVNVLAIFGSAFSLVVIDAPRFLAAFLRSASYFWFDRIEIALHASVLIISLLNLFILANDRRPTLRRLRRIECATFGPILLYFGWDQIQTQVRLDWHQAQHLVGSFVPVGFGAPWLVIVILYGTLIPNTWRRSAKICTLIGLTPIILFLAAEGVRGFPTSRAQAVLFIFCMLLVLGSAIPAMLYNVYRSEVLFDEVREARKLGQYRLGRRLGAGGMGEVYLAEHLLLRRPCAIKLIRADRSGDPASLQRFGREVQATATLTHFNTVQIFDYGHTRDGTFYYVMEYLEGLTAEELVQRHGPIPPGRVVHFLRQVCSALHEAHAIGLVHRDIKPSNIMICRRGGLSDVVKLLDFGLVQPERVREDAERITQEGTVAGTPSYMSPEQAGAGADLDGRSDIYSLGCVAYFLLTGRPPFTDRSPMRLLAAHIYAVPVAPSAVRDDIPADLEAIVLRCLAKAPPERFADVRDLSGALSQCVLVRPWTDKDADGWWQCPTNQYEPAERCRPLPNDPTEDAPPIGVADAGRPTSVREYQTRSNPLSNLDSP